MTITYNTIEMKKFTKIEENWSQTKAKLKAKFVKLTDNDLLFAEGQQEDMMNRLQKKLGKTKEEIQHIISDL